MLYTGLRPLLKNTDEPKAGRKKCDMCTTTTRTKTNQMSLMKQRWTFEPWPDTNGGLQSCKHKHTRTHTRTSIHKHGWMTRSAMCAGLWHHGSEVISEMMPGWQLIETCGDKSVSNSYCEDLVCVSYDGWLISRLPEVKCWFEMSYTALSYACAVQIF